MDIQTKYHGVIQLSKEEIVHFANGIPGFPDDEQFLLLPLEEDETFLILQSVESTEVAFVMVNPFTYFPDYDFTLEDQFVEKLGITVPEDILVYCILTVQDPFINTTANLQAPIIINSKNKRAKQIVLNNDHYSTRHKIMDKR